MNEKTKSGYVAGVISTMIFIFFIVFAVNSGWNMAGQVMGVIGLIFGIVGLEVSGNLKQLVRLLHKY